MQKHVVRSLSVGLNPASVCVISRACKHLAWKTVTFSYRGRNKEANGWFFWWHNGPGRTPCQHCMTSEAWNQQVFPVCRRLQGVEWRVWQPHIRRQTGDGRSPVCVISETLRQLSNKVAQQCCEWFLDCVWPSKTRFLIPYREKIFKERHGGGWSFISAHF